MNAARERLLASKASDPKKRELQFAHLNAKNALDSNKDPALEAELQRAFDAADSELSAYLWEQAQAEAAKLPKRKKDQLSGEKGSGGRYLP